MVAAKNSRLSERKACCFNIFYLVLHIHAAIDLDNLTGNVA